MVRLVFALVLVTACSCARAEIFKCKTSDGRDLYQNFPCSIDSLGLPSNPAAKSQRIHAPAVSATAAAVAAAASKTPAAFVNAREPQIGMTAEQVRTVWGEPSHSYYDELVDGRVEVWAYDANRAVHFDLNRRVSAIQR